MSDKPQTTRTQVRGVLNRPDVAGRVRRHARHPQAAHAARRAPERHRDRDRSAASTSCASWSTPPRRSARATGSSPRGCRSDGVVIVNKVDAASPDAGAGAAGQGGRRSSTLERLLPGVGAHRRRRRRARRPPDRRACPRARSYYPDDMVTDVPEAFWVAELVREQLLAVTHDELPALDRHAGHRVGVAPHPRRDPRRARLAEGHRDRRKGGRCSRQVGTAVREQLPPGAFVELFVKVDKDWQRRPKALERLGY